MRINKKWFFLAPVAIVAILAFIAIGAEIVEQLWNWLLPPLFGWRQITFWQALALLLLCRILFGGLGGRGSTRSSFRRRVRDRWAERWEHMTPEEREKFQKGLSAPCGFPPPIRETKAE